MSGSNSALLDDADGLQKLMRDIAEAAGLHHLESVTHQFSPQGISAALLLSESHIAIHTWPESGVAYIAMTTCKSLDDDKLQQIKELVARVLGAKNIIMKEMAL
ncbi:adenosylmethionine decarboxylase [Candidatus Minimicrobia naudis]|uniref:Adenosylmethionine decarboxylase n=1 Tax=Candidatus Minimicrobia naudis TaxID=2841263 RepID=A0A8F1MBY2_9BACT|nr:adenosylmethionine decarboxylase [Candidatus Minimicrobia naudis]